MRKCDSQFSDGFLATLQAVSNPAHPCVSAPLREINEWNIKAGIERYLKQRFTPRTIKELEGSYHGPDKVKKSGKAAGAPKSRRKAEENRKNKKPKDKAKQRHRHTKNIGKRRQPKKPLSQANTGKPPKT